MCLFHLNYSDNFLNIIIRSISSVYPDLSLSPYGIYKVLGMGSVCSCAGLVQNPGLLTQHLALSYPPAPAPHHALLWKRSSRVKHPDRDLSSVVFDDCIPNSRLTQHCCHSCFTPLKAGRLAWSLKGKHIMARFPSVHKRGSQRITES